MVSLQIQRAVAECPYIIVVQTSAHPSRSLICRGYCSAGSGAGKGCISINHNGIQTHEVDKYGNTSSPLEQKQSVD